MATINLTGTIVDSTSQAWAQAIITARLVGFASPQGLPRDIAAPTVPIPIVYETVAGDDGSFSLTVESNVTIDIPNTGYEIFVQPNATTFPTVVCAQNKFVANTDISTLINNIIKTPAIECLSFQRAYAEDNIIGPFQGAVYINTGAGATAGFSLWMYDGVAWIKIGGGGGGGGIGGSGTAGFYSIFTAATTLADGTIDSGVINTGMNFVDSAFMFSSSNLQNDGITFGNSDGFSGGPSLTSNADLPIDVSNGGEGLVILADDGSFLEIRGGGETRIQWFDSSSHNFATIEWVDLVGVDTLQIVGDALQLICNNETISLYCDGGTTPVIIVGEAVTNIANTLSCTPFTNVASISGINIPINTSVIRVTGTAAIHDILMAGGATPVDGQLLFIQALGAWSMAGGGNIFSAFTAVVGNLYIGVFSATSNGWFFTTS